MRVLIVSNTYPPADISGVGALVWELAHRLGANGHRVRVLTRRAPADDPYAVGTGGGKMGYPFRAALRFLSLAKRERYDLVHVHESDGVFVVLVWWLCKILRLEVGRARLVSTLQVSYRQERLSVRPIKDGTEVVSTPTTDERIFAWLRAPAHALFGRVIARLSEALVAPSRVTRTELVTDYGGRDVFVIENGIDPSIVTYDDDLATGGEDAVSVTILYVGRLRTRKAVAVLLTAFQRLRAEAQNVELVVIGGGEQLDELRQRSRKLRLGESCRFLGPLPRSEVVEWYHRADIYCLPSIYEGFPVAILEAMAAGLPVVSTTVSGIPEAVAHGETGLLVPPEDAASLQEALRHLVGDSAERRSMGLAGRRRVLDRFTIDVIAQRYLALWHNLLGPAAEPVTEHT
ncbi:MAG: glycosyltransferase family 4 protein [Thermoanaerobaculia bacterium]|nr:glycosyltransferase family 4 protein [Thermoanaerobaculia bacterium]